MIVLSPRLKTAADMVRKGVVAADIGTDHAYLPSYLVLNGICPRALACDLRKGPLENAAETLERWNISDKITLRLSDGLDELSAGEADDIIMAGIGRNTYRQIARAYRVGKKQKHKADTSADVPCRRGEIVSLQ